MRELRDGDETGEVSEVRALVVELDEAVMLGIVSLSEGLEGIVVASRWLLLAFVVCIKGHWCAGHWFASKGSLTGVHRTKHAGDELVDAVALLNQRHQRRNATFVVSDIPEVGEDEFLELLNLVLQHHEVGDGLVALIRVIDGLQAQVFLVLERSVELLVLVVEGELRKEVVDVFADQGSVTAHSLAVQAAVEAVDPAAVGHCLLQGAGVAFLEDLVDGDEGLEGLDFVGEDRLAVMTGLAAAEKMSVGELARRTP